MHLSATHVIWIVIGALTLIAIVSGALAAHFRDEEAKHFDRQERRP
jgi:hypothetical protein